jgi:hypothetical protein
MRYALKAVQYLYLGRVARRSPCIEESGGRRKFGPQTTPQDTGVARSPHTPTTSTGTTPTVRIFTDTRRRSRTQLLPRRRGGTRGHLFSRSIDVHGGPKQGGAGAPASDLADGDARVRAKPALRKRPHALRPGTARSPCTPLLDCEHGRSRAARSPAGAAAFSMSNSRKLLRPVSPEGHTSSAPRTGRTCGGNRLPA